MYPSDHYHTMTDAQLAQWHRLQTCIDRLTRELQDSRDATAAAQVAAREEADKLRAELAARAEIILAAHMKQSDLQSALRRSAGEQLQLLKALRRLVAAVEQCDRLGYGGEALGVLAKILREGKEVVSLLDIPF